MKKEIHRLAQVLKETGKKVALAESMTAGLAAHMLSNVKGASDILLGSIVCYHPEVKTCLLGVEEKLIEKHSAESMQVTDALVRQLANLLEADIYCAVTGLASAGGSESKHPAGTVFISVYHRRKIHHRQLLFRGTPLTIKNKACEAMYKLLNEVLKK